MGFMAPDAVIDKALEDVALSDRLYVCSDEPTSFTEASSTQNLATIILTAGKGNGDWTIGNGDTSGRKLTIAEQAGTGTTTGTATHVAFGVNGSSTLKFVCTLTSMLIQAGVAFTIPSKDVWEIRDPS